MYSISSQIFEGITEYLTNYTDITKEENEEQRGPFGSGKVMADILRSDSGSAERKYLHDYSYTLFEKHLRDEARVLSASETNVESVFQSISEASFVAITGKPAFNDVKIIKSTIESFNQIGEALTFLTNSDEIEERQEQLKNLAGTTKDRNARARIKQQEKQLEDFISQTARTSGLQINPKTIEYLSFMLEYGFQDLFEVQMFLGNYTFSASLKREYIRENEHLLVRKYSRFPEKKFVLFGTVAQGPGSDHEEAEGSPDGEGPTHLKEMILAMASSLGDVEAHFSGRLENEVVIDPIALYCEI